MRPCDLPPCKSSSRSGSLRTSMTQCICLCCSCCWLSWPGWHVHRVDPRLRDLVLLMATVPAALRSMRHIPILVLVLVPILASLAEAWLQQRGAQRLLQAGQAPPTRRIWPCEYSGALVTFVAFTVVRVRQVVGTQAQTEAQHFPQAAVEFLSREHPPGPILNHYNFGGYFIWKLYPAVPGFYRWARRCLWRQVHG